ncbi:hypothetical protein [Veronia pacifica]|nr:hypothetical protein [Veronia pacifica]
MAKDKQLHFGFSFASTVLASLLCQDMFQHLDSVEQNACGAMATFGAGLAKEVVDSYKEKNIFSADDIVANMHGIVVGSLAYQSFSYSSKAAVSFSSTTAGNMYCDYVREGEYTLSINACGLISGLSAMALTHAVSSDRDQNIKDGLIGIVAASISYKLSDAYISGWFDGRQAGIKFAAHF